MKSAHKSICVVLTAIAMLAIAQESSAALLQSSGHLTLLRVHDVGSGFGPGNDFLDVEVVIQLDSVGGSFGFQLRDDGNRPARQGMLDLLRDAFNNDWRVTINYEIDAGDINGEIIRVWLTKT